MVGLIEKPEVNKAPSNMACIGRYVLTLIFLICCNIKKLTCGEIQLSDAINLQAQKGKVEAVKLKGRRFDCGSVKGYINAIRYVSDNIEFNEE